MIQIETARGVGYRLIEKHKKEDALILINIIETLTFMAAKKWGKIEEKLNNIEIMLNKTPYLRELALFHQLKGIYYIHLGAIQEGREWLNHGIDIAKQTQLAFMEIDIVACSVLTIISGISFFVTKKRG